MDGGIRTIAFLSFVVLSSAFVVLGAFIFQSSEEALEYIDLFISANEDGKPLVSKDCVINFSKGAGAADKSSFSSVLREEDGYDYSRNPIRGFAWSLYHPDFTGDGKGGCNPKIFPIYTNPQSEAREEVVDDSFTLDWLLRFLSH